MLALVPQSPSFTVQNVMTLLDDVDLTMIKRKLTDKYEGHGWTQEYVDAVEILYRRYLCMLFMNPKGSIVPTRDIDLFWHQHILDTRAYACDCQRVFGYFVHHFPYFGMRDEEDAKDLLSSFEGTKCYYKSLFGMDYVTENEGSESSSCHKGPGNCHKCSSQCSRPIECKQCKSK